MGISCRHHFAKHIKSEQERLQTVPEVSHGHMRHIPHSLSTRMCACLPTQSSFCLCTAPSATRAHLRSAAPNLSEQLLEPPVRHAPAPEMVDRMEVRPAHSGPAPRCWKRAYGRSAAAALEQAGVEKGSVALRCLPRRTPSPLFLL